MLKVKIQKLLFIQQSTAFNLPEKLSVLIFFCNLQFAILIFHIKIYSQTKYTTKKYHAVETVSKIVSKYHRNRDKFDILHFYRDDSSMLMLSYFPRDVVVVIVWQLDLQIPVQSVPITTKVVSSNIVHGEVYSIQHYEIKFVRNLRQVSGFLCVLQFPPPIKLTATI